MNALTPKETATLYLLNRKSEAVDLTFFERVYGSDRQKYYHRTFTQQYKDTFTAVKQKLLRRGLLVMAELRTRSDNTKMERWRFRFPPEFAAYLPPLIADPHHFEGAGDDRSTAAQRAKVLEALDTLKAKQPPQKGSQVLVERGHFTVGKQPISVKCLAEWQQSAWAASLSVTLPNDGGQSLPPVEAVRIILKTLNPGEWASLDQIAEVYAVFCFGVKAPPLQDICKAGWESGGLVRQMEKNKAYYRLPATRSFETKKMEPDDYLMPTPAGDAVQVDLVKIPFEILETLNILAHLAVENKQLVASPSKVKLGRATPETRESTLGKWLASQIPAFGQVFEAIAENWGKTILHTRLLVAQVKDLSLRIQLEKSLGSDLILLSEEFVAFPLETRREVEKIVQKGGFVVKTVKI